MSKIKVVASNEEDKEIIIKVEEILSLPQSKQNSQDKIFIDYLKYIFTNEFIQDKFSFPKKKKEKKAYKYLKNYITILSILFKKDKNKRDALYRSDKSEYGNEIVNLLSSLDTYIGKINIEFNSDKVKSQIFTFFFNYYSESKDTLSGSLTFYFYCLSFVIPKLNTLKLLFFHFLKRQFPSVFKALDYGDYYIDLSNINCINLMILFLNNLSEENIGISRIYAILLSKFEIVFSFYKGEIDINIIKKTVEQTYHSIKNKRDNIIILIFDNFVSFLQNNIEESKENKIEKKINISTNENKIIDDKNKENDKTQEYTHIKEKNESQNKINNNYHIKEKLFEPKESIINDINEIMDTLNKEEKLPLNENIRNDYSSESKKDIKQNSKEEEIINKNNIFIKKCTGFEQEKQLENVNIITSKEDKRLKEEKMVEDKSKEKEEKENNI